MTKTILPWKNLTSELLWLHEFSDLLVELFLREWRNHRDIESQAEGGTAREGITHLDRSRKREIMYIFGHAFDYVLFRDYPAYRETKP